MKNSKSIQVGSVVVIEDTGSLYSTFTDWFNEALEANPTLPHWDPDRLPLVGDYYTVSYIAPHLRHPEKQLAYCVSNRTGKGYIMGTYNGLELVENPSVSIGSTIKIKDRRETYPHYDKWMTANKIDKKTWNQSKLPDITHTFTVSFIAPHGCSRAQLAYCVSSVTNKGYIIGISPDMVVISAPVVKSKPTKVTKVTKVSLPEEVSTQSHTRAKRRQFDVVFKQGIVRAANKLKKEGKQGDISILLKANEITPVHLCYWRKQHNQGHFTIERAVAFSRKNTMVHG